VESQGDHRIAMAFAIASLAAERPIEIRSTAEVATSFPSFVPIAVKSGLLLDELDGVAA
jgi:3-phosphoshikimate 1-carboxyvinyltransferase